MSWRLEPSNPLYVQKLVQDRNEEIVKHRTPITGSLRGEPIGEMWIHHSKDQYFGKCI